MPLFFFHLRTPHGLERDEDGLNRPDLDSAYLEACRAIPQMSADFMEDGVDPLTYAFEIADASGTTLMEVPFNERLRSPRRPSQTVHTAPSSPTSGTLAQIQQGRRLVAEMRAHVAEMATDAKRIRATMDQSYRLLKISRAGGWTRHGTDP